MFSQRLKKKLFQVGIESSFANDIYEFRFHKGGHAQLLLPSSLELEEKAIAQLMSFAETKHPEMTGNVLKVRATPDFHAGSCVPVGTIIATEQDFIIPMAVGTDINCGMRLIHSGLNEAQLKGQQSTLIEYLKSILLEGQRNIPMNRASFEGLFDEGLSAMLPHLPKEGLWETLDHERFEQEIVKNLGQENIRASTKFAPSVLLDDRQVFRPAHLGTVGGGNHFVEFQVVEAIMDGYTAYINNIHKGDVMIMLHTGSRDIGFSIGNEWMNRARNLWPKTSVYPKSGIFPVLGQDAEDFKLSMGVAARYAWLNRICLTEMIRREILNVFGDDNSALLVDVSHNLIFEENGVNVHRKGAAMAHSGELVVIPGSMGDHSYLCLGGGDQDWLSSCSHGAGRAVCRQKMHGKINKEVHYPFECYSLRESRVIEERPEAYKPIEPIIESQEKHGLITKVAKMRPLFTFKV